MEIELLTTLQKILDEKITILSSNGVEEKAMIRDIKLMGMGAEAVIARGIFLDINAVIKWRFPKPYMPLELDKEFRRIRTATEAKALLRSLAIGINVPTPLYVDPDEGLLIMTYIDGNILRDIIDHLDKDNVCSICRAIGVYTAKIHENSIVHGDITTSNIIISKEDEEIYIIDFGLANFTKRLEDQAIDIHIFFRSIESAHHVVEDIAKKCFIDGYRSVRGDGTDKVLSTVIHIRKMGRYVAERRIKGVWRSL